MKSTVNNPDHSLPYHLRGAFRGFETALARYLETIGVPLSYFHILRLQWDGNGSSQLALATKAFMTESVASQVVKKMVKDGLLRRVRDPNDKRVWLVHLTAKGKRLREKVVVDGIKISNEHAADLSREDALITIEVLKKIRLAFDKYNDDYKQGKT